MDGTEPVALPFAAERRALHVGKRRPSPAQKFELRDHAARLPFDGKYHLNEEGFPPDHISASLRIRSGTPSERPTIMPSI